MLTYKDLFMCDVIGMGVLVGAHRKWPSFGVKIKPLPGLVDIGSNWPK